MSSGFDSTCISALVKGTLVGIDGEIENRNTRKQEEKQSGEKSCLWASPFPIKRHRVF
jgi:hypothetical protein